MDDVSSVDNVQKNMQDLYDNATVPCGRCLASVKTLLQQRIHHAGA